MAPFFGLQPVTSPIRCWLMKTVTFPSSLRMRHVCHMPTGSFKFFLGKTAAVLASPVGITMPATGV